MCEHVTTPTNVSCLPFWVTAPGGQQALLIIRPEHITRQTTFTGAWLRSVVISNIQRGGRSVACIIICMLTVMFWCLDSSNTSQWRDSTLLTTFQMTWLCSAGAPLSYELTSLFGRHKAETARSYLIRQHTFDTFYPLSSNLFLTHIHTGSNMKIWINFIYWQQNKVCNPISLCNSVTKSHRRTDEL